MNILRLGLGAAALAVAAGGLGFWAGTVHGSPVIVTPAAQATSPPQCYARENFRFVPGFWAGGGVCLPLDRLRSMP